MAKYKGIMGILILTGMTLAFPAQSSTPDHNEIKNIQEADRNIVAKVNGFPIYEDQLEVKVQAGLDKYSRFNNGKQPEGLKQQIQASVLDQYITAELLYQASQKQKIKDIEKKIAEKLSGNEASQEKISEQSIRRQIYMDEYLAKNNLSDPQLPEKELKEYYEKFKNNFAAKKDTTNVQHIIIKKDKEQSEGANKAKETIEKARKLIADGADFSDIAIEYSQDANAAQGGDLGFIEHGYMPEEFEKVAFTLEIGVLSDVIETEFGYHILEVLERKYAGEIPTFDEVKDFLAKGFQEQLKVKNMTVHIEKLKENSEIQVMLVNPGVNHF